MAVCALRIGIHDDEVACLRALISVDDNFTLEEIEGLYFLSGKDWSEETSISDARSEAMTYIERLNTILDVSGQPRMAVSFADLVVRGSNAESFNRTTMDLPASVMIRSAVAPNPTNAAELIEAAKRFPEVDKVLKLMQAPDLFNYYKVLEIIEKFAGGEKAAAAACGVNRETWSQLTGNINHPDAQGEAARHAVAKGTYPASKKMSKGDIDKVIQGIVVSWTKSLLAP